jgi:MFS transporter, UMF1 family
MSTKEKCGSLSVLIASLWFELRVPIHRKVSIRSERRGSVRRKMERRSESGGEATPAPSAISAANSRTITRSAVVGWILYDLANTIFSMGVVSLNFPLWIRETVGPGKADARTGLLTAISMGLIFFASPLLGAMTDRARRRMPFLIGSTLICVCFTGLLGRLGFFWTAVFFIIANIAYQAGTQFYDAMLPEVSTEDNRGRIGGIGVGIGYFGSYIAVGLGLWLTKDKPLLFLSIAIAFLVFSIPCFLFVKERGNPKPRPINFEMIRNSTDHTWQTLRASRAYPGLLRFLIGRVFYTDPINTVITFMSLYTVNVAVASGLTQGGGEKRANIILMFAITFAILGGFFWGWLADKHGPKRTLNHVLRCWMAIFLGAASVGLFALPIWTMYAVAASAGFCLGGVWAADRPYMLRLTPPDRIGEFYGLYGMVGRFSAVTGPLIWALVTSVAIQQFHFEPVRAQGVAILVLLLLMFVSYWILQPVSDDRRDWDSAADETAVRASSQLS